MTANEFVESYTKEWPDAFVAVNVPMNEHTTFRLGGLADVLVAPYSEGQLLHAIALCRQVRCPFTVIGGGSNLIVRDGGIRGVVIKLGSAWAGTSFQEDGTVKARAGARLMALARESIDKGLSGMAFASGIPGSVGGAIYMNAGAYGGETKNIATSVTYFDIDDNIRLRRTVTPEDFGYRSSVFQQKNCVIIEATFKLVPCFDAAERLRAEEYLKRRREKQPVNMPSAGSVFKRPEGNYAGTLIEKAGLKGFSIGGAQVSEKHAGFIVNKGGATAADVLTLIEHVRTKVFESSGVMLEQEIRVIGEDGYE